jgi:hypothetical protein
MVTLCYLRRFLSFFEQVLQQETGDVSVSKELADFFRGITQALEHSKSFLTTGFTDVQRKDVLDSLGEPASEYRWKIYENGFSGKFDTLTIDELSEFTELARLFMEQSIRANKREDGLYHAYNLMTVHEGGVKVSYLAEMLEGQVAVLSSKYLTAYENADVLDSLKSSALFRDDQYSYTLYPNKDLPRFTAKNCIASERAEASELIAALRRAGDKTVVLKDREGVYHFNGMFNNVNSLNDALDQLPADYDELVSKDRELLSTIFEEVFDHKSFTGRSGTFFGYEGLGSIYWHMVSKLLLAAYENTNEAIKTDDEILIGRMYDHYFEILAGIGAHKSPKLYGAFPTDPYSHTPGGKGAQQPGMTGQVKEDLISRFGELGVSVKGGQLTFAPRILRNEEFLNKEGAFEYVNLENVVDSVQVPNKGLAFTYCQVPVIYERCNEAKIVVHTQTDTHTIAGNTLSSELTSALFRRTNSIKKIAVSVAK